MGYLLPSEEQMLASSKVVMHGAVNSATGGSNPSSPASQRGVRQCLRIMENQMNALVQKSARTPEPARVPVGATGATRAIRMFYLVTGIRG